MKFLVLTCVSESVTRSSLPAEMAATLVIISTLVPRSPDVMLFLVVISDVSLEKSLSIPLMLFVS